MHDNRHIQTVAKDFPRSREREPSISKTFLKGKNKTICIHEA